MSDPVFFGYHPISGLRLSASVCSVPGYVPREITKVGHVVLMEDGCESEMNWDASQDLHLRESDFFLADDFGNECLASEAIWQLNEHPMITPPADLTATSSLSAQTLRAQLEALAIAAKELLDLQDFQSHAAETVRTLVALSLSCSHNNVKGRNQ